MYNPFFFENSMPDFASEQYIQNLKGECPHRCEFHFFGRCVRIQSDDPAAIETLRALYRRFIDSCSAPADLDCCFVRSSTRRRGAELTVGRSRYELPDSERSVGYAELIVFRHILELLDDYIVLHAGVVSRRGRALVMYGQSGFGKTTLTLELVRRGYGFMSDEFCPIRIRDLLVEPFERLVGLKKSSPLYHLAACPDARYCASEGKDFFDCSEAFASTPAQPCRPAVFIEIAGKLDPDTCPPGGVVLDLCMCRESPDVHEAISQLPGVTVAGPFIRGRYPAYRLTAADRTSFVARFNRIWAGHHRDIFSVYPYRGEVDGYDRLPVLQPRHPFDALTSIMSNVVNRSPGGMLLAAHGGTTAPLAMQLGRLLNDSACYSLQPGRLANMADLIDNLV